MCKLYETCLKLINRINLSVTDVTNVSDMGNIHVVAFFDGNVASALGYLGKNISVSINERVVKAVCASAGDTCHMNHGDHVVFLVNLGGKEEFNCWTLQTAFAKAVSTIKALFKENPSETRLSVHLHEECATLAKASVIALFNAIYSYKSRPLIKLETAADEKMSVLLCGAGRTSCELLETTVGNVLPVIQGSYLYRILTDGNADEITPDKLGEVADEMASHHKSIKIKQFVGQNVVSQLNMGLLHAVSRGGNEDPRLIHLTYNDDLQGAPHVVLVGKGITFDTGGLNIKPDSGMIAMRVDMSGAAMCLGVLMCIAHCHIPIKLTVIIATCDNAIGPMSYKQGDVYSSRKGLSVEIVHTDAEGRLVLADALDYAGEIVQNDSQAMILDFATLTGAMIVALGEKVCGFFANDGQLAKDIIMASEKVREPVWRLPLIKDQESSLDSRVADIANCHRDRKAGSVAGALFLQRFVPKGVRWAHFDIAGVSSNGSGSEVSTGFGIDLMKSFVNNLIA